VVDRLPVGVEYIADSADPSTVYDASLRTLSWSGVKVPAGKEVEVSFGVTTQVEDPRIVINIAMITADEMHIERSCTVTLGKSGGPVLDRPLVESFKIDATDVLMDRDVTLYTHLQDGNQAEWMYFREWQLSDEIFPRWEVVQSSGWIPYQSEHSWKLGSHAGVHYVTVWVADGEKHVSLMNGGSYDFASLLVPDAQIEQAELAPYQVRFKAGEQVQAVLTPSSGDPDLYVWYPDNFGLPDQIGKGTGLEVEKVNFTAPRDGVYIFMIHGFEASSYSLEISPAGGSTQQFVTAETVYASAAQPGATRSWGFMGEPLFSIIGLDPYGTTGPAVPDAPWFIYIPNVLR
ncbi:MAG TPA: hypothetical protein VHO48_04820, partial [Anaerolineaceae bacterium]|nr:hypothetical protein [Anaerolineaceae bacterium]